MSISSRISSMEEHVTKAYNGLQGLGADLTNVNKNIENISMVLDDIYDSMPQVSGEGTSLTLDDTRVGKIKSTLKGNTSQTGTPTPTSPIPVNVVSGDNEITISGNGKNLFNKDFHIINGSFINGSGGITSDSTLSYQNYFIEVEQNTEYTISSSETTIYRIARYNSSKTFIDRPYNENASRSYTINTGNAKYIKMAGTLTTALNSLQIEKGSSATSYEPYIGNTYNIDLPVENLFEGIFEEGGWDIQNGQKQYAPGRNRCPDLIAVKPSTTYTISFENTGTCYVLEYGSNSNYLTYSQIFYHVYNGSFTTNANTRYITFYYIPYNHDFTLNEKCQLELGSKVNTYTPYGTTPIELCSSKDGTLRDYLWHDKTLDKWYWHREIGKYVFTGEEQWSKSSRTDVTRYYNYVPTGIANDDKNISNVYSNYFLGISQNSSDNGSLGICPYNTIGSLINIDKNDTNLDTIEKFKTFLSTNKPSYYYILATPTNTEITYQPLIDQLNLLEKAMSKDGQTNISQVNNDLPFIISASALKEWQESTSLNSTLSMVNPLSLGNTLNTQEIENNTQPIEVDNIEPLEEEENEES